jgi:Ulp1 family protease
LVYTPSHNKEARVRSLVAKHFSTPVSFVLIPWFFSSHWSLFVAHVPSRSVFHYDSLAHDTSPSPHPLAAEFLAPFLWPTASAASASPPVMPRGSLQSNGYDCGVFMLMTMECLVWDPSRVSRLTRSIPAYRSMMTRRILNDCTMELVSHDQHDTESDSDESVVESLPHDTYL